MVTVSMKKIKIDSYLYPFTKLKSKWIKYININPTTLNLIEQKEGSSLQLMGTGDHFLNNNTISTDTKATINKWDLLKLRSFCKVKDTVNKTKRQPTE